MLLNLIFFGYLIHSALLSSENNVCHPTCKTCSRLADRNACTSCYPRHFKRSFYYEDTVFQCSEKCPQSYSLPPIKGQRFRYCNISKIANIEDAKVKSEKNVIKISEAAGAVPSNNNANSDSSFLNIIIIVVVIFGFVVAVALSLLIYFKKSSIIIQRQNSLSEELLRKESEASENGCSEKSEFKREYLYIAGSKPKYSQLIIITNIDEISIEQECNAGHFSKVYRGKFRNQNVAIKIAQDNGRKSIHTELKIYDKICHANILPALAVYFGVKNMLVMPFRNYNLSQYFDVNRDKIIVSQLLQYTIQIADAMAYLHSLKIIHCDLKCDNILMKDSTGKNVEISDFGCAVDLSDEVLPYFTGSTTHAAYELLKGFIYYEATKTLPNNSEAFPSKKSDIWSFAITVWQIFQKSSKIPENFRAPKDIVKNYESGNKLFQPKLMPDYIWRYIILKCLDLEPEIRPKMSEIFESLKRMFCKGDKWSEKNIDFRLSTKKYGTNSLNPNTGILYFLIQQRNET